MARFTETFLARRPGDAIQSIRRLRVFHLFRGEGLKARAIRGSVWTVGGTTLNQFLRLGSNLILTRLLFPEAFGLMALVAVFIRGLNMFSDVGLAPNIIQNKRGDEPVFLNTAWTVQVIRGFVLFGVVCIGAWPFAMFYKNEVLIQIIPVVGLTALIGGFNSTAIITASKRITLGQVTCLNITVQIVGIVVMIGCALIWRSVWALVIGGVAASICKMVLSHVWLADTRNRFCWDRAVVRDLVSFGKWIFLATILTFVATQSDQLILGKVLSMKMFGVFSIAYMIYRVPRDLVMRLSKNIIFPAVSQWKELPRHEMRAKIERNRWPLLVAMAGVTALLFGFGDFLILGLWDERYAAAAPLLPVLALGLWPRVLDMTTAHSLVAIRKLHYNPIGSLGRIPIILVGLPIAFALFGLKGAVVVVALSDLPNYIADLIGLRMNGLALLRQDLVATLMLVIFSLCAIVIRVAMGAQALPF